MQTGFRPWRLFSKLPPCDCHVEGGVAHIFLAVTMPVGWALWIGFFLLFVHCFLACFYFLFICCSKLHWSSEPACKCNQRRMLSCLTVVAGLSLLAVSAGHSPESVCWCHGHSLTCRAQRKSSVTQLSGIACDKAHTLVVSMLFSLCGLPLAVSPAEGNGSPSSLWLRVSGWVCRMLLSHTGLMAHCSESPLLLMSSVCFVHFLQEEGSTRTCDTFSTSGSRRGLRIMSSSRP